MLLFVPEDIKQCEKYLRQHSRYNVSAKLNLRYCKAKCKFSPGIIISAYLRLTFYSVGRPPDETRAISNMPAPTNLPMLRSLPTLFTATKARRLTFRKCSCQWCTSTDTHFWISTSYHPKDTRFWPRLKGITEKSDYDSVKQIRLSHMDYAEGPKGMVEFRQRRQRPGESYGQFAVALQAILVEAKGHRFSPGYQGYLVLSHFIGKDHPPTLQAHLKLLEHADIGEFLKTFNALVNTLGNLNYLQPEI
ncbi:hypothetical protein ACTXT7_011385 [Hymenolepis weldensis]